MLQALKTYNTDDVEKYLSNMALSMIPNPDIYPLPEANQEELELRERICSEICKKKKVNPKSPKSRPIILEFLSSEMTEIVLQGQDISKIRKSIGQNGMLSTRLYKIEFNHSYFPFKKTFFPLGLFSADLQKTLKEPTSYKHIVTDEKKGENLSIYLRAFTHHSMASRHFTLVTLAKRKGDILYPLSAWNLYHSEFKREVPASPLDAFRMFADKYGLEINVGNGEKGKFFFLKTFLIRKEKASNILKFSTEKDHIGNILYRCRERTGNNISCEIAYAFVIDVDAYKNTLRKYGVIH